MGTPLPPPHTLNEVPVAIKDPEANSSGSFIVLRRSLFNDGGNRCKLKIDRPPAKGLNRGFQEKPKAGKGWLLQSKG